MLLVLLLMCHVFGWCITLLVVLAVWHVVNVIADASCYWCCCCWCVVFLILLLIHCIVGVVGASHCWC